MQLGGTFRFMRPHEEDRSAIQWPRTAFLGGALLLVYFCGWEVAERFTSLSASGSVHALHILRGVCAGLLLGSWTFVHVRRAWNDTDRELDRRASELELCVHERTAELHEARVFTEHLLDALRERIVVTDSQGRVVKANRIASLPGPLRRGEVASHADGNGRLWEVERLPLPPLDGHRGLVVEIGRDVTEERNLFAQLCQREKMASLGLLAAGIAHDLASPLTAISTEMELLVEDVALPAVRASFEVVRRNVSCMSGLLTEMVNFARRRCDDATRVCLADVAKDSVTLVRHDRRFQNVRLEVEVPECLPPVRVVEDHLVLVLVNLLSNAADAMVEGGRIRLAGRAVSGGVELTVRDDGCGMSDEVKKNARSPLFTTKPRGAGTGLGLFVADGIVRDAGGTLSLTSEVGVGTEIAVWLPMVKS